jgi:hypothetical protein
LIWLETEKSDWKSKITFSPEDAIVFNSSRLLLLLDVLNDLGVKKGVDLERLSYYDFFAANPFLIIGKDDPCRLELEIEGFEPNKLEYLSSDQRYRTKRTLIKQYLSLLLSKGLIKILNMDGKILYEITPLGIEISSKINSMYAIAYKKSVTCVVKMLKGYSDAQLWEKASEWLEAKSFQVDLYDMVDDRHE